MAMIPSKRQWTKMDLSAPPVDLSAPPVDLSAPPMDELIAEAQRAKVRAEVKVKGGLSEFFSRMAGKLINWLAKTLVPALLSAALFPILGPVGAAVGATAVTTTIQAATEELKALSPRLHESTINKLVEPLQGKQFDESELQKVIWGVLSDRQANEDLKQFFMELVPTIQEAAKSTHIEISGPVQGLVVGNHNTITQTFDGFLQDKS